MSQMLKLLKNQAGLLDGETLSVYMEEFRREMLHLSVKHGEGFVMVGAGFRPVKSLSI